MLWYKTFHYGTNTLCTGYSVIQISDGGFALGGYQQTITHPATGDPIIIKTDSLGNQEWIRYFGGPYLDNKAFLANSSNGNILVGTVYSDEMIGNYNAYNRINVIKMTVDNIVLWDHKFEETTPYNFLDNIKEIDDGSIVCTGSCYTEVPYISGWILKINNDGDSIWYRRYKY